MILFIGLLFVCILAYFASASVCNACACVMCNKMK